jgi:PAS domain S-box-containing protein
MLVWACDVRGEVVYLNRVFRFITGAGDTQAISWQDALSPDQQSIWHDTVTAATKARAPFGCELTFQLPEGTERLLQLQASPRLVHGRHAGFWGTAVDISARRRIEQRLRGAEEKFRILAEQAGEAVVMLDNELRVTYWNKVATRVAGAQATTVIGKHIREVPPPIGGDAPQETLAAALKSGETWYDGQNGTNVSMHVTPLHGGLLLVTGQKEAHPRSGEMDPLPWQLLQADVLRGILFDGCDALAVQDPQGRYLFSRALAQHPLSSVEAIGKMPHEIFARPYADAVLQRVRAVCATGATQTEESSVTFNDVPVWVREQSFPLRNARQEIIGVCTATRDISAEKVISTELRAGEELYRMFVEHSHEGIWRFKLTPPLPSSIPVGEQVQRLFRDAMLAESNNALAKMYGYEKAGEIVGVPLRAFFQQEDPAHEEHFKKFVESGYSLSGAESRALDRNGQPRFFINSFVGIVKDDALMELWGSQSEITHRRMADREMRLLAQTIASTKDCISITDLHNRILFVNDAFLTTYGYEEEELIGKSILIVRGGSTEEKDADTILRDSLAGGWNGEVNNQRKDGSIFPVELWTSMVHNDEGNPVAVVGVARDITERKKAEEQIRLSLHEKEVMLKEIHHRVKNNLQVISSLLNLQSEYISDPETLRFFRESQNRVKSMALIHEKLYQSSSLAQVDFGAYLRELSTQLFRSYATMGGGVSLQLDTEPVSMTIDLAIPCGIIVNELITNAIKYAFVSGTTGRLLVSCRPIPEDMVRLVVSDDGVGLPNGLDVRAIGSLGLKLVTMLCDQLRGKLTVTRGSPALQSDRGTEFVITFPRTIAGSSGETA